MNRKSVAYMLLTIVLAVYLGAALCVSAMCSDRETSSGLEVRIDGQSNGFVTPDGVYSELGKKGDIARFKDTPLNYVNLEEIETVLNTIDNIEHACAYRSFKGENSHIVVTVTPMQPVARIFDNGKSYYVNRSGKRLTANFTYRVDVPVVIGHFNEKNPVSEIMPIIDYMKVDRNFSDYISSIEVAPNRDIIIYPMMTGPVINFGDTTIIKNKIHRIMRMYETVLPVVGADFYDTISVKWDGQVVATRHKKTVPEPAILFDTEMEPESIDLGYLDTIPYQPDAQRVNKQ